MDLVHGSSVLRDAGGSRKTRTRTGMSDSARAMQLRLRAHAFTHCALHRARRTVRGPVPALVCRGTHSPTHALSGDTVSMMQAPPPALRTSFFRPLPFPALRFWLLRICKIQDAERKIWAERGKKDRRGGCFFEFSGNCARVLVIVIRWLMARCAGLLHLDMQRCKVVSQPSLSLVCAP